MGRGGLFTNRLFRKLVTVDLLLNFPHQSSVFGLVGEKKTLAQNNHKYGS